MSSEKSLMHIVIDGRAISHPRRGGFKTYVENLVIGLANLAHDSRFTILYDRNYTFPPITENPKFQEVALPSRIKTIGQLYREHIAIPGYARKDRSAIWHLPYNRAPLAGIRNYVLTLHDVTPFTHRAQIDWSNPIRGARELALFYYPWLLIRQSARQARTIITVSKYAKEQIVKILDVPPEKISVTHLAASKVFRLLDPDEKKAAKIAIASKFDLYKPFLFAIASSKLKNPHGILTAYSELPNAIKKSYDLVIVTAHNQAQTVIQELIKKLNIEDKVHILKSLEPRELLDLYNMASLFVFPSFTESFGLPPLEAMACGTPVIASNVTAMPEVLGDAALLIDPADTEAISQTIRTVLTNASLAERLSQKGLQCSDDFSWKKTSNKTMDIYRKASR
jgi:glycosyltransferase involved in cell wall biosynthesis